jgi:hypothetical protein
MPVHAEEAASVDGWLSVALLECAALSEWAGNPEPETARLANKGYAELMTYARTQITSTAYAGEPMVFRGIGPLTELVGPEFWAGRQFGSIMNRLKESVFDALPDVDPPRTSDEVARGASIVARGMYQERNCRYLGI